MKKVLLYFFAGALFLSWVVASAFARVSESPVKASNVDKDSLKSVQSGMLHKITPQARPMGLPVSETKKPVILTPELLIGDGQIIRGWEKKPFTGKPNVPNQNIILQGGDDIASATLISSLPYTNTGTTEGYNDDYDEACPDASNSPDVVYSYAPVTNETVDIYLHRISFWPDSTQGYDTKLFVYENDENTSVGCNDDFFYYGQSALQDLALTSGNTYYIVVDGYAGQYGKYTIDMMISPPRPPNNYCSASPDTTLENGVTFTFTGDSRYALDTDGWFPSAPEVCPEVFISFIVPFTMDVTLDFCGTDGDGIPGPPYARWGVVWLNHGENCPLDGSSTAADLYSTNECVPNDGNFTLTWYNLPAGTYNYALFSLPEVDIHGLPCWGPYVVHLTGFGCPEDDITVEIMTDEYPEETLWEIWDNIGNVLVASGGPYTGFRNTLFTEHVCVDSGGCHDFFIFDTHGDGICCDHGYGYFKITYNEVLVDSGGEFGVVDTVANVGDGCPGACCVEGDCVATNTLSECNVLGGEWYLGEDCFGDPPFECPVPITGACCYDDQCVDNLQSECDALNGYWYPGEECASFECLDVIYHEDFDVDMGDWSGEWALTSEDSHTPPNSLTDSPGGDYISYDTVVVELTTDISLTGYVGYGLEFYTKFLIELGFDYVYLDISTNGGANWSNLAIFNGEEPEDSTWHIFAADLSGYFDQSVRFKFTLITDAGYNTDGMYIDDFYVYGLDVDNDPPLIIHTGPTDSTSVPDEFTAVAIITDPSGVAFANLTYTVDEGDPVIIDPDQVIGDEYTFIIPEVEAGAHVEYFISAEDNIGNPGSTPTYHYVSGTIVFYDDGDPEYIYSYEEGNKIATRFTPTGQATLVTGMLRLYTDINHDLDTVDVEIWFNDENDLPGGSLWGPAAVWPQSTLENPQAWTYVDFRGEGLTFNADEDFHLGFGYRDSIPYILGDSPAVTGRSSVNTTGNWSAATTDFHIRVVLDIEVVGCDYIPGDANGDGNVMGNDVTYSVRYFKGLGNPPPDSCWNPVRDEWLYSGGDANGNCAYTGSDVTYLVGYFKGYNPEILYCPDTPPANPPLTLKKSKRLTPIINPRD